MSATILNYNEIDFNSFSFTENDEKFLKEALRNPNETCAKITYGLTNYYHFEESVTYNNVEIMHKFLKNANPKILLGLHNTIEMSYIILKLKTLNLEEFSKISYHFNLPLILFKDFYVPDTSILSIDTPSHSDIIRP